MTECWSCGEMGEAELCYSATLSCLQNSMALFICPH